MRGRAAIAARARESAFSASTFQRSRAARLSARPPHPAPAKLGCTSLSLRIPCMGILVSSAFMGHHSGWPASRQTRSRGGACHSGAEKLAPQPCIRWDDPDHDAAMRIGGEAPRWRAHSLPRRVGPGISGGRGHLGSRSAPCQSLCPFEPLGVCRGSQDDPLGHHAGGCEAPQRDQKLARQRHDHDLARAWAGILGPLPIPPRKAADLVSGDTPIADPSAVRLSRFQDGSKIRVERGF
jgi:hypothetical protein